MTTNNTKKTKFLEPFQPFVGKLVIWIDDWGRNLWLTEGSTGNHLCGSLEPDDLFVVLSLEFARARDCDGEVSNIKILHPKFGAVFVDLVYPDNLAVISSDEESE